MSAVCVGLLKADQLTPRRRVLLEKPTDSQMVKKYSALF
jgi:hypothetical protein